jgi:hypothetical protein
MFKSQETAMLPMLALSAVEGSKNKNRNPVDMLEEDLKLRILVLSVQINL